MSEPMPTPGEGDIMLALEQRVRERREKGIATYGRSLQAFNGRRALVDALEEAIDLAAYLEQERYERARLEARVDIAEARVAELERRLVAEPIVLSAPGRCRACGHLSKYHTTQIPGCTAGDCSCRLKEADAR